MNLLYFSRCLTAAGGDAAGKLDFYQIHSYAHNEGNKFNTYSPLKQSKSVFGLNKPVVIGEYFVFHLIIPQILSGILDRSPPHPVLHGSSVHSFIVVAGVSTLSIYLDNIMF